jgi:hypothetical protein
MIEALGDAPGAGRRAPRAQGFVESGGDGAGVAFGVIKRLVQGVDLGPAGKVHAPYPKVRKITLSIPWGMETMSGDGT